MPLPPDLSKPIFALMPQLADRVLRGQCTCCGIGGYQLANVSFRDEISRKEFSISGMCQSCQDSVFQSDEDGEQGESWAD